MKKRGRRVREGDVMTEAEVRVGERLEDAILLALMMGGRTTSQGMQVAYIIWKKQGNRSSLKASRINTAL